VSRRSRARTRRVRGVTQRPSRRLAQLRSDAASTPRPGVAEPQGGQEVEPGRLRAAVVDGDRIRTSSAPPSRTRGRRRSSGPPRRPVSSSSYSSSARDRARWSRPVAVRELPLRVLVEVLHVGVGRRRVEVEVVLLDVLAVVPLAVGEAEQALLEDRIALVPEARAKQSRCCSSEIPPSRLTPAVGRERTGRG